MSKRRCLYCKDYFDMMEMVKIPAGWFCCHEHIAQYAADRQRKQAEKTRKRAQVERKRQYRDNDRSYQLKQAQTWFNKFIRLRDKGRPCPSCGRHHLGQIHAGHFLSVGSSPGLRFNQFNCWAQCSACNNHLSGNAINYRIGLVDRIGADRVEWLEQQRDQPKKWLIQDIKAIKYYYRMMCKRMEG